MSFVPSVPGISVPNSRTSITSFTKFSHEARMKLKNGFQHMHTVSQASKAMAEQADPAGTSGQGEDIGSHCKCDIDHGAGGVPRGCRIIRHLGETCPSDSDRKQLELFKFFPLKQRFAIKILRSGFSMTFVPLICVICPLHFHLSGGLVIVFFFFTFQASFICFKKVTRSGLDTARLIH